MSLYKFFRVATEGATTDGRAIQRDWIEQAAKNFSVEKYAPRVWLEHIRGLLPDSVFKAYGDVVALEAREVEEGKLALFAQIQPSPELIELNRNRQKLYTSIEINPNFADTGEAYLIGLGVTDSPASLGTDMLQFSAQNGTFNNRKQDPNNLFGEAVAVELELLSDEDGTEKRKSLSEIIKDAFQKFRLEKKFISTEEFTDALNPLIENFVKLHEQNQKEIESLRKELNRVSEEFVSFKEKIRSEDANEEFTATRPVATGEGELVATY